MINKKQMHEWVQILQLWLDIFILCHVRNLILGLPELFFFWWWSFLFIANIAFTCFKINLPRGKDFMGLSAFDGNYICSFVMTTGTCPTHIVQITLPAHCARTHILAFTTGSKQGRTCHFTRTVIGSVQNYVISSACMKSHCIHCLFELLSNELCMLYL